MSPIGGTGQQVPGTAGIGQQVPGTGGIGQQVPGTEGIGQQVPGTAEPLHPNTYPLPITPPPEQDTMTLRVQAVLGQTEGLKQMVEKMNTPTTSAWSQSGESCGKSLDTKGMLRCDNYRGEKELLPSWKKQFYGTLD